MFELGCVIWDCCFGIVDLVFPSWDIWSWDYLFGTFDAGFRSGIF